MKNQFIEGMLENLQNKVEELLDEVETMNNTGLTIPGESIEDQVLEIKENLHAIRELYEAETVYFRPWEPTIIECRNLTKS